jgi:hypothetical protein
MSSKISKRRTESNRRAQRVAREVRWQLGMHGKILNNEKLGQLIQSWMNVTGIGKYEAVRL